MEKNKSLVIQAKPIEKWDTDDGKTFYIYGIAFKDGNAGRYYSPTKEQDYFQIGHEAEYQIEKNEKEPKKSKIKPITAEKKSTNSYEKLGIEEYIARKKVDTIAYSARYATDIYIAHPTKKLVEECEKVLAWQLDKLNEL